MILCQRWLLVLILVMAGGVTAHAQSCVTPDEVKQLLARVQSPPATSIDQKLRKKLLLMSQQQGEMLLEVVEKDQTKASDQKKLHKLYQQNTAKFCEILKSVGWPSAALVDRDGVLASFQILNNATFELQRDLLPVIVASMKKDPEQKPLFAGFFDRLRVSAGMKQLFGTQAMSMGGFLVLYPIEDQTKLDSLRAQFGLPPMDDNIRELERTYGKPLVKARQPPTTKLSKQLTDSITQAIDSAALKSNEIDPGDVIKTETSLVSLNVSVFTNNNQVFTGSLAKDDFHVEENGKEQTVTYFASTDVPFDLVLLIDLSGSTLEKRDLIKASTLRFIEAARPSDRLAIVTFSDKTTVVSPLTLDRVQLAASVAGMQGEGGSHVWDAIKFALDNVLGPKLPDRRRAIVMMSDGVDGSFTRYGSYRGSATLFADLIEQVRGTDALIVPIYLDTEDSEYGPNAKEEYENARRALNLLARESGGSYYKARKLPDLNGVYEQVINDLGKVYSLGYKPTNEAHDNSWRWVKVSVVNRPELTARTRPGYYAQ